jgi:hypothetical protein
MGTCSCGFERSLLWPTHLERCKDTVTRFGQAASDMTKFPTRRLLATCLYYCHTNLLNIKEMTRIAGMVGRKVGSCRSEVRLNYFGCVSNDEPVVTVLADREVGALVSRQLPWENQCLEKHLPRCHFAHQKPHADYLGLHGHKLAINCLRNGTLEM